MNLVDLIPRHFFDTPILRAAGRVLGAGVLFCVLLAAVARAETADAHQGHAAEEQHVSADAGEHDHSAAEQNRGQSAVQRNASPSLAHADEHSKPLEHDDDHAAEAKHENDGTGHKHEPGHENAEAAPTKSGPVLARGARLEERLAYFAKAGVESWLSGKRALAEESFAKALNVNIPPIYKRDLLLQMAELYELDKQPIKAIAALEKLHAALPDDPETPVILLRLGILYRDTGAYGMAAKRLYSVLNSTLAFGSEQLEGNRRLAMKARLEIAETHAVQGQFEEARRYYSRLQLLDLSKADAERVEFREAQLQYQLENWGEAAERLGRFIADHADSRHVPEARYQRSKALENTGRRNEAKQEVVTLLSAKPADPSAAVDLAFWKRRSGNEMANRFYEEGDFHGALSVYQALARASADPSWRWPAVYQVGLCFERLRLPARASEAYQLIVAPEKPSGEDAPKKELGKALVALQDMARWRLEHLEWIEDFENRVQILTSNTGA